MRIVAIILLILMSSCKAYEYTSDDRALNEYLYSIHHKKHKKPSVVDGKLWYYDYYIRMKGANGRRLDGGSRIYRFYPNGNWRTNY